METILEAANPGMVGAYYGLPDHANRNWQHAYYGNNYRTLARLRAKYDPLNTFGKTLTPAQDFSSEDSSSCSNAEDDTATSGCPHFRHASVIAAFLLSFWLPALFTVAE